MNMTESEARAILNDLADGRYWFVRAKHREAADILVTRLQNYRDTINNLAYSKQQLESQVKNLISAKGVTDTATSKLKDVIDKHNAVLAKNLALEKKMEAQAFHADKQQEQMETLLDSRSSDERMIKELKRERDDLKDDLMVFKNSQNNTIINLHKEIGDKEMELKAVEDSLQHNIRSLEDENRRLREEIDRQNTERVNSEVRADKLEAETQGIAALAVEAQAKLTELEGDVLVAVRHLQQVLSK